MRDVSGCVHRGNELRRQECPSCRGTTQIKIFACAVHGECQLTNKIPDVTFCRMCSDFAPEDAAGSEIAA